MHRKGKTGRLGVPRILLAEDNPADVYLIQESLREHDVDCSIKVASDGREVLSLVMAQAPATDGEDFALIILDINLPRHDGIEILARLHESARMAHVPVVILTSSDSPQDRQVAIHLGARRYLRKPSNLEEFLDLGSVFKELLAATPAEQGA